MTSHQFGKGPSTKRVVLSAFGKEMKAEAKKSEPGESSGKGYAKKHALPSVRQFLNLWGSSSQSLLCNQKVVT
ncbi:hypothetical protein Y1Q_0002189 [Alligator mississippiensis]|uniref:Uncharacterized protein n=1 Tax=Alligator mississippiensis TaxID=8496 RepID=A0A151MQ76_ALLMI|nr:hypothetical protein Y1Q_0002189 [Alligator mississippiensis]